MANLDLTDRAIASHIITEIEGNEEKERKKSNFDAWQVYSGNVTPYVRSVIETTRPKSHKGYTISDISFSKVIVDAKSKAYKEDPLRFIEGNDDAKNNRIDDIYKEGGALRQLPFLDTITNLHKHSLIWVNNLDESETYQFMTLQGYEYSVVRDKDTGELDAVILNYGNLDITQNAQSGDGINNLIAESQADSSADSTIYAMWSKDNYVIVRVENTEIHTTTGTKIKKSIDYIEQPENPGMINVLGMIPFVFLSHEMAIDYPTMSPLKQQTITANALASEYYTAANIQGSGQMIFKYPEKYENMFSKITTGLLSAIKLPQSDNPEDKPTTAEYINPSPDLAGQKEAVFSYVKQMMNEHGLKNTSAVGSEGQDFSSGLQMAIANSSVQDIIEENQQLYVSVENQMFEIIKAWEAFRGNSVFKEDDELSVVFKKPKVMISDAEVLANIEKRLNLGLMEKYEALMTLDPNLSEDDAKEKAQKIMKANISNIQGMNFGTREDSKDNRPRPFERSEK
jgi:hypothetical protein